MIVFHYTSEESYNEIRKTGRLTASSPWTTMDSAYGSGWYFTDLEPSTCEMAIVHHCWRNVDLLGKVQYYLKFEIDNSILKKCRDHVYMIGTWDGNLIKYLSGNKNKDCTLKPCDTCEKAKKYKKLDPPTAGSQENGNPGNIAQGNKLITIMPDKEFRPINYNKKRGAKHVVRRNQSVSRRRQEPPPPSLTSIRL